MKAGTFLASEMRLLWRVLESRHVDPRPICREVGLDPEPAETSRARHPFSAVAAAWRRAAERSRDPLLGLRAAEHYRATDFHGLAVVFLASSDLRTALRRLVRYHIVVNTALTLRLEETEDRLTLSGLAADQRAVDVPVLQDVRAALILDLCRNGASGELDPVEVTFTYAAPEDSTPYRKLFRCPLRFGAPVWSVSFALEDADRPFLASNRELALSTDRVLEKLAASLREGTLPMRAKLAILEELPTGTPTEARIARTLSVSSRSLQRKLAEAGTSFRDLLLQVRRELGERYVEEGDLSVTEIAYMLGFADVSSFSRAYKRWTGSSPAAARRPDAP